MKTNLRKRLKAYGNTVIINFTSEELKNYKWELGDLIEIREVGKIDEGKQDNTQNSR
jgi:RNA-binding protein YlmH